MAGNTSKTFRGYLLNCDFEPAAPDSIGSLPVWILRGRWKAERLNQLLPDQANATQKNLADLPPHLPDHAGQVSLPGGAMEPGETGQQAAIREFHEELGADDEPIVLLGRLSPLYVATSNFRVEPWVGVADRRPQLVPNPTEVDELLEVPLAHLLDPAHFGSHQREAQGRCYTAPHFAWQTHRIWGATCMILGELVTLLEELGI